MTRSVGDFLPMSHATRASRKLDLSFVIMAGSEISSGRMI